MVEQRTSVLLPAVARIVIPRPAREYLRDLHNRYVLARALRRFARAIDSGRSPSLNVLSQISDGWANEPWSPPPDYLAALADIAERTSGPILECGSGISTLLLGIIADRQGREVWSLEHLRAWAERVQGYLDAFQIRSVRLNLTSLREYGDYCWYEAPIAGMPGDFSLVICDGPPGTTRGGRYGLLPVMRPNLAPGCVILLDDAQRAQEQAIVSRWAQEFDTRTVGPVRTGEPARCSRFALLQIARTTVGRASPDNAGDARQQS